MIWPVNEQVDFLVYNRDTILLKVMILNSKEMYINYWQDKK